MPDLCDYIHGHCYVFACVFVCIQVYVDICEICVCVFLCICVCVLVILCSHVHVFMVYMYVPAFACHIVVFNKYLKNTYTALQ